MPEFGWQKNNKKYRRNQNDFEIPGPALDCAQIAAKNIERSQEPVQISKRIENGKASKSPSK